MMALSMWRPETGKRETPHVDIKVKVLSPPWIDVEAPLRFGQSRSTIPFSGTVILPKDCVSLPFWGYY